ncbi:hypothetical protein [Streptomyces sp. 35G-GA-8]|uniref:hypothetical protein n=1 Tax=Streptomyces sp. 35G-GA-8 TaxID=2939434 RepID=UPI00201F3D83|nr:hypothetical protein [Streptomyces sp. 35G-GA-8]MCL7380496.1 hypothetical protein [Streptomyces sp. 35G-GA-8]
MSAMVCTGDTLTHLPSKGEVTALLRDAARCLATNGQLVPSYRDLTRPLTGTDRALPVCATDERIMTCFLEYVVDTVMVHDLIHTRASPAWLIDRCRDVGLHIQHSADGPRGLHIITATKS